MIRDSRSTQGPGTGAAPVRGRPPGWLLAAAATVLLLAPGCRELDPCAGTASLAPFARPVSLLPRARGALDEGHRLEHQGSDESVDRYYEAAVVSFAAVRATSALVGFDHPDSAEARELYNESLRDCLRAAQHFGRLDPASHLLVNTPAGSQSVPISHRGFVWAASDFNRVVDPTRIRRNPEQHNRDTSRPGLGADLAVVRANPETGPADRLLPHEAAFNATAVLRPDLDAWLGSRRGTPPADRIELLDPLRVGSIGIDGQELPLAANFAAASAAAYQTQARRGPFALAGFALPGEMLERADIKMLEPYQPGKMPVLLVHGLLDDPFLFTDMLIALQRTPGLLDRYQLWVYRYPTGVTFLRSATLLRSDLREAYATLDPASRDPALQRTVLVGYSMGGLLARLQVTSSGNRVWAAASNRPLETLVTTEATRGMLRDLFFFEPSPNVRRVVFIATPHGGSPVASSVVGRMATRVVRRPSDTREAVAQLARDNPGALSPLFLPRLPSSIDVLAADNPLLPVLRTLPFNPAVTLHTIAGHGPHPPERGKGDLVVPLESAHVESAVSELWVPAIHTTIYYHPETIAEVRRILAEHAAASP
jgi:hypothetical protein